MRNGFNTTDHPFIEERGHELFEFFLKGWHNSYNILNNMALGRTEAVNFSAEEKKSFQDMVDHTRASLQQDGHDPHLLDDSLRNMMTFVETGKPEREPEMVTEIRKELDSYTAKLKPIQEKWDNFMKTRSPAQGRAKWEEFLALNEKADAEDFEQFKASMQEKYDDDLDVDENYLDWKFVPEKDPNQQQAHEEKH